MVKNPPANTGDTRDWGSISGSGRSAGEGNWQLTPVFLPRESLWTEEAGRLQPMGSQRDRQAEPLSTVQLKYLMVSIVFSSIPF